MTIFVFRCVYLVLVLVGLAVNVNELRNAMLVYQTLVSAGINGARQVLASHFVRKALMLCGIQVFLAVPAVLALTLFSPHVRDSSWAQAMVLIGVLSHMAAVLCLMLMALMSWYDRNFSMNMLTTEAASAGKDFADRMNTSDVIKRQLDEILAAVKQLHKEKLS